MNTTNQHIKLFTLAHRGEAKGFLKHMPWSRVEEMENLYESESSLLLISGEGRVETLIKVSGACALFKPQLIVNYGTCGALREGIQPGAIYSVRTAYAANGIQPEYKSFSSLDSDATVDCISAGERVQDKKKADKLGHFAHLVDREAWAIGAVAQKFKIPFVSYKLVTDLADGCLPLSDRNQIGELLWTHFKNSESISLPILPDASEDSDIPEGFYFTIAQKRRFRSLYRSFKLKTDGKDKQALAKLIKELELNKNELPKRRTTHLLEALTAYLSPFNANLRKRLEEVSTDLRKAGWDIQFDPAMESEDISLKAVITSKTRLQNLTESLQQIRYEEMSELLRGNLNTGKDNDNV
ncbi:MAG: hypothetical protein AAFP70_06470 [Calditrichota bacterium]